MSITRRLPGTNVTRQQALNAANDKNTSSPGNDVLKTSTATALSTGTPVYNTAMQNVANAKALFNNKTGVKDAAVEESRQHNSHFIQVFNLGVARNKYRADSRPFYHLDANSDAVPNMDSEADVKLWGHYIVDGDAARMAGGGLAMANPDASEVATKLSAMETLLNEHSTLDDDLDAKQEIVNELNEDADVLIKKIWDEVEANYGSESPESKRHNCRQWGLVYITKGPPAALSGLVKNADGTPAVGATVTLEETEAAATTNSEGRYTINTVILGPVGVSAKSGALTGSQNVNIPDHTDGININVPDITLS